MHPAYSVIVFTTASGLGYGLLMLLGALTALGVIAPDRYFGLAVFVLAFGSMTVGLLSSLFHLGHPERAWRALSQWRTSWLSREGVLALAVYAPALVFAAGWIFAGRNDGLWAVFGSVAGVLSLATVCATGMIYASLKPVPQWHNGWVVPVYVALALATGALALDALARAFGVADRLTLDVIAIATLLAAATLKLAYWGFIDRRAASSSAETATGLGGFGTVRLLDPPHTGTNYLMREMGYRVARKHAARLRTIVLTVGFGAPLGLVGVAALMSLPDGATGRAVGTILVAAAAVLAFFGVLIERWLFFAEARHSVTLYYGADKI